MKNYRLLSCKPFIFCGSLLKYVHVFCGAILDIKRLWIGKRVRNGAVVNYAGHAQRVNAKCGAPGET